MISNCGHDENGKYHGGKAGDQTGTEWYIKSYSNYPYNCILRHPDAKIREMIADQAEKGAKNDNIGYNQWDRYSFENELIKAGDLVENIKTPCNSDCSEGVTAIVRSVGRRTGDTKLSSIDKTTYTATMRKNFKNAGFQVLTAAKYFSTDAYHLRGDIILNDEHHVVISLSNGSKSGVTTTIQNEPVKKPIEEIVKEVKAGKWGNYPERKTRLEAAGYSYQQVQDIINGKSTTTAPSTTKYKVVNISSWLNVRKAPSTSATLVGKLYNNNIVNVIEVSNGWAKLDNGNYISAKYIEKV